MSYSQYPRYTTCIGRIGVIGDIHAEDQLLAQALAFLHTQPVERIVATGDIADGAGDLARCCQLLTVFDVLTVSGNHDRWLLQGELRDLPHAMDPASVCPTTRRFLAELPNAVELITPRGLLLLCHGLGTNDEAKVMPNDNEEALAANGELQSLLQENRYRFIVNGHSHHRMVKKYAGLTLINAGTLRRDRWPGFLVLDFYQGLVRCYQFNGMKESIVASESLLL
jgi:predicted phosphodiesterase